MTSERYNFSKVVTLENGRKMAKLVAENNRRLWFVISKGGLEKRITSMSQSGKNTEQEQIAIEEIER
jgi:hypothetical protein